MAQIRVVFAAPQGDPAEWPQYFFELAQECAATFGLAIVQTILNPQTLAAVGARSVSWQDAVVQAGKVFCHRGEISPPVKNRS
jgi:hypothetical protein